MEGISGLQYSLSMYCHEVKSVAWYNRPRMVAERRSEARIVVINPWQLPSYLVLFPDEIDLPHVRDSGIEPVEKARVVRGVEPYRSRESGEVVDHQHTLSASTLRNSGAQDFRRESKTSVVEGYHPETVQFPWLKRDIVHASSTFLGPYIGFFMPGCFESGSSPTTAWNV